MPTEHIKNSLQGWGYRVLRHVTDWKEWFKDKGGLPEGHPETEDTLMIHEVYYDKTGKIHACTEEGVCPRGETLEELKADIDRYISALEDPIINYADLPEKDALPIGVIDPKKDLKKVALTAAEIIQKAKDEVSRNQG
jgi:hypothetical protein